MTTNTSGIYQIKNTINNHIYIGSAINLKNRIKNHKWALKHNRHSCQHLQKAYIKYGVKAFEYSIVMYCALSDLLFYEQRFLNVYYDNNRTCYNITKTAGSLLGYKHTQETKEKLRTINSGNNNPRFGKFVSDETKQLMSIAHSGERNGNFGKPMSDETKAKMSAAKLGKKGLSGILNPRAKLTWEKVREIRHIHKTTEISCKKLSIAYNICCQTICNIINNKQWIES